VRTRNETVACSRSRLWTKGAAREEVAVCSAALVIRVCGFCILGAIACSSKTALRGAGHAGTDGGSDACVGLGTQGYDAMVDGTATDGGASESPGACTGTGRQPNADASPAVSSNCGLAQSAAAGGTSIWGSDLLLGLVLKGRAHVLGRPVPLHEFERLALSRPDLGRLRLRHCTLGRLTLARSTRQREQ
jgi:hypothetical protein